MAGPRDLTEERDDPMEDLLSPEMLRVLGHLGSNPRFDATLAVGVGGLRARIERLRAVARIGVWLDTYHHLVPEVQAELRDAVRALQPGDLGEE